MKNLIKYSEYCPFDGHGLSDTGTRCRVVVVEEENKTLWDRNLPNFRYPDQRGINEFEPTKDTI